MPDAVSPFMQAPPSKELEWDEDSLVGQVRWVKRLDTLVAALEAVRPAESVTSFADGTGPADVAICSAVHATIAEVTKCMDETCSFNGTRWWYWLLCTVTSLVAHWSLSRTVQLPSPG